MARMENYAAVKARIFARQSTGDVAICSVDDELVGGHCQGAAGDLDPCPLLGARAVGRRHLGAATGCSKSGVAARIWPGSTSMGSMPALAAVTTGRTPRIAYGAGAGAGGGRRGHRRGLAAASPASPIAWRRSGSSGKVIFVNDTKATNADAAEKALLSFDTIYWIVGGIAKAGGIEPLRPLFRQGRAGLSDRPGGATEFAATLEGGTPYRMCGTLEQATEAAARDARADKSPRCRGAAVAGLRLLRPISQFRGPRRCLPQGGAGA